MTEENMTIGDGGKRNRLILAGGLLLGAFVNIFAKATSFEWIAFFLWAPFIILSTLLIIEI